MNLPLVVLFVALAFIFLGFSVACVIYWFKITPTITQFLKDPKTHWTNKYIVYYGIGFSMFLVAGVFISFIVLLALVLGGNV